MSQFRRQFRRGGKVGRASSCPLSLQRRRERRLLKRKLKKDGLGNIGAFSGRIFCLPKARLLDALMPERHGKWIHPDHRRHKATVDLRRFSFIDAPDQTLDRLRDLVKADCVNTRVKLNFQDDVCLDIGPYMVLSLIEPYLAAKNISGGIISADVHRVLEETTIASRLKMEGNGARMAQGRIRPIPMQRCHNADIDRRGDLSSAPAQLAQKFADHVNEWLRDVGFELSEKGDGMLLRIVSEVLENAVIHSDLERQNGEAWLSGFMACYTEGNNDVFTCNISVINVGASIYQSLQTCSPRIRAEIEAMIARHRPFFSLLSRWKPEALWTLYALQDGVSRMSGSLDPRGGRGLMDMIDFFMTLGGAGMPNACPEIVIISGSTCLKIVNQAPASDHNGMRRIALNTTNDLHRPPDPRYITRLKRGFPGTILSMRFQLDPSYLQLHSEPEP